MPQRSTIHSFVDTERDSYLDLLLSALAFLLIAHTVGAPLFAEKLVLCHCASEQMAGFRNTHPLICLASNTFNFNPRLQPCRVTASTGQVPQNYGDTANTGNILDIAYDFHLGNGNNGNV